MVAGRTVCGGERVGAAGDGARGGGALGGGDEKMLRRGSAEQPAEALEEAEREHLQTFVDRFKAKASKAAGRVAAEGIVAAYITPDGKSGAVTGRVPRGGDAVS